MSRCVGSGWYCPLFEVDIAEGKCLDINYERLGYLAAGCLDEIERVTGKREPDVTKTCESCPNQPFADGLGPISFPTRKNKS